MMSSWFYLDFFPAAKEILSPENAIGLFPKFGLSFCENTREAKMIDEQGHWEFINEGPSLGSSPVEEIQKRLLNREQFQCECTNKEMLFYCGYLLHTNNPLINICGSRKIFNDLSEERQNHYWNMMVRFAIKANAGYVLVSIESFEDVEDRFIEIDNRRVLDLEITNEYGHGIKSIWVNSNKTNTTVPIGLKSSNIAELGDGLLEYSVE